MSVTMERETEVAPDVTGEMVTGVLLMAYGSPQNLDEVEPYLRDIRGGRRPDPEAVEELKDRYRQIGGHSPLLEITQRQAAALQQKMDETLPGRYRTYVGMKHWHPFIAEAMEQMVADNLAGALGLVMAPHFSKMSIGGYEKRLKEAAKRTKATFPMGVVPHWYEDPGFVGFSADNLRVALAEWDANDPQTRVFFTAHSLPQAILKSGDPYRDQLVESAGLVAKAAGVKRWEFAFQSASETGSRWLGPDIGERLEALAAEGGKRAVIYPIGFVADHLEILYDIDIEAAEKAKGVGLELRRSASPNDDPAFIEVLSGIVRTRGG